MYKLKAVRLLTHSIAIACNVEVNAYITSGTCSKYQQSSFNLPVGNMTNTTSIFQTIFEESGKIWELRGTW